MRSEQTPLGFFERMALLWYSLGVARRTVPGFFSLALVKALLDAAHPLVILVCSARIVTELSAGRDPGVLALTAALTVALSFALTAVSAVLERAQQRRAGWTQVLARIRMLYAERFAEMDFTHTEDTAISEALARMDTYMRGNGLGLSRLFFLLPPTAQSLFTLALSLPLLASQAGLGGGAARVSLPLFAAMLVGTMLLQRAWEKKGREIATANAAANTAAQFYFGYIKPDAAAKDIRLYAQAPALHTLFAESFPLKPWLAFFRFGGHSEGYHNASLSLISGVFYLLVGAAALGGATDAGGVVQSVGAAAALFGAAGGLLAGLSQLYSSLPFLAPSQDYLTLPDLLEQGDRSVPARAATEYVIEFRGVSFRYPGSEEYALKNLNLTLSAGRRLAVVGRNGSGKTTMIKLLCRLYDPTEGEILLDGVNIKEYNHTQYTALFSAVFQDFVLFPLSLGQNVAAAPEFDAARVADCLERAGFGARLAAMPDGADTVLYKRFDKSGVHVSGGEAQKIALARALYKDAPFVVLDEPTAALDPVSEYEVYTTFNRTIGDRTAVFISHRLSSCRFADEIAVFDGGEMVQRGGHEALLADESGKYYALWTAQAQYYTEGEEQSDAGDDSTQNGGAGAQGGQPARV